MSFWSDLANVFSGRGQTPSIRTPPYISDDPGTPGGPSAAGTTGIGNGTDWTKYLPLILAGAGAGTQLIGSKMASNQMNRANDLTQQNAEYLRQQAQQEQQRRAMLTNLFLPSILKNMGYRGQNPMIGQRQQGQVPASAIAAGGGTGSPFAGNSPTYQDIFSSYAGNAPHMSVL